MVSPEISHVEILACARSRFAEHRSACRASWNESRALRAVAAAVGANLFVRFAQFHIDAATPQVTAS